MVDKTTQLLLKTFGVLLKAIRRTKAQKQDDKAKALRGRMASPRIQERISMVDLARLAGEVYTDLRDPSTTPQGFGRALREGKQDLESAQDVSIDRRVANLADKREGEATKRDREKSARLQVVRRRNDEPPTPVNAFLKAFGVMKAPTSEENARKLNRELKQEKRERKEIESGGVAGMRAAGMPEDQIPHEAIRFTSRVKAPSNLYTSEAAYRSDPDFEAVSGGTQARSNQLLDEIKQHGKARSTAAMKEKYGDWDKPGQSVIQNLKKAEEDKSVAPIRSVAPNRRRREAEILREGRRELKDATKGLPPLVAARVRREAAQTYRKQRFGGVPGTRARNPKQSYGGVDFESTETKTVRPKAKRVSDKVLVQGPERQQVNTGMGKRGSDVPTRSVEHSTRRMVSSARALAGGARDDIAAGRTIAAKDPKTTVLKPDDYKITMKALYKAFGIMKAPTSKENAEALNRQLEWEKKHEAKRVEEEREKNEEAIREQKRTGRKKPRSSGATRATDEALAQQVSGETHLYDSEEAIRSAPARKAQEARLRQEGFPERRDQRKGQRLIDTSTGKQVFGDLPGLPSIEELTDDYVKRYKKKQKQKTAQRLADQYPGDTQLNMEKASILKAFGVMKARSAANKAKNRRALGMRRTKAENRKIDALFARARTAERSLTPKEHAEMVTDRDVNLNPFLKPAGTAAKIVAINEATERQREWGKRNNQRVVTKPRIKNPYEHIDASGRRDDLEHAAEVFNPSVAANPESWTPAQQRLMTDAEKNQQRAVARIGEQKLRERRKPTLGEVKRRHTKQGA